MSDYITLHNGINTYQYYNSFNKKVDKIIKSNDLESINNYRFVNCSFFMIYVQNAQKVTSMDMLHQLQTTIYMPYSEE